MLLAGMLLAGMLLAGMSLEFFKAKTEERKKLISPLYCIGQNQCFPTLGANKYIKNRILDFLFGKCSLM